MTWFQLRCVDTTKPDAEAPALLWLEDISSVGPAEERITYPLDGGTSGKVERVRLVITRPGAVFMIRPDEGARLEGVLEELEMDRLGLKRRAPECVFRRDGDCAGLIAARDQGGNICDRHWGIVQLKLSERR